MAGDTAADAVLDMLACPTHAHLLAHPGVAWGVGAAHAAATAPGASAGAAAATAGAYVPSDLAAEKRVRGQKLLDAAADVDEYASRCAWRCLHAREVCAELRGEVCRRLHVLRLVRSCTQMQHCCRP